MKKYEIKTTKDILNAVNSENLESFLQDFSVWLKLVVTAKELWGKSLKDSNFTWKDDGEYGKLTGAKTEIEIV